MLLTQEAAEKKASRRPLENQDSVAIAQIFELPVATDVIAHRALFMLQDGIDFPIHQHLRCSDRVYARSRVRDARDACLRAELKAPRHIKLGGNDGDVRQVKALALDISAIRVKNAEGEGHHVHPVEVRISDLIDFRARGLPAGELEPALR